MISTLTPPNAGRRTSLSGAGEVSRCAYIGRRRKKQVSVDCATRLRRRSASARILLCHIRTAPKQPFLRICSVVHIASAAEEHFIQNSLSSASSHLLKVRPFGICGGCTRAIRWFFAIADKTGLSNCNSPIPGCCTRSSINADRGHPEFGNSLSNSVKPDVRVIAL